MTGSALVFGAGGVLGRALMEALVDAHGLDRSACDIRDPERVRAALQKNRPAVVYNCAAYTSVDGAEKDRDTAFATNAQGAENVALAAQEAGAAVVYVSTDFVFGGNRPEPYDEYDPVDPQSVYGKSKWAGEERTRAATARHFVVRSGGLYGAGGKNFPSTILRRLRAGETLSADRERRMTPTWVRPLAAQMIALAETPHFGTYHATCQGETTFYDFACATRTVAGLPEHAGQIVPVDASAMGGAPRPLQCVLVNRLLRARGLDRMPPWQEALRGWVDEGLGDQR